MPTLSYGQNQITQNTIYALPPNRCILFTDAAGPTLQQSATLAFTLNVPVALTNGQMELGGAFLRCTSGNINIVLSR